MRKAFTLIELLVVIAIRASMAAFRGRLYVLAIHENQPMPSLYCFQ